MQNIKLATRYAKSLMDLASEHSAVDAIYTDATSLKQLFAGSKDLTTLVKSPIISADKKQTIFKQIIGGKVHQITEQFVNLVTSKGRESVLPEMMTAYVDLYKTAKNIHTVKLTIATQLDEASLKILTDKIAAQFAGDQIDVQVKVDESLIGGFIVESNNKLFDASVARDLKDIQKQFAQNIYVKNIR